MKKMLLLLAGFAISQILSAIQPYTPMESDSLNALIRPFLDRQPAHTPSDLGIPSIAGG